jgi:hypothetical protein
MGYVELKKILFHGKECIIRARFRKLRAPVAVYVPVPSNGRCIISYFAAVPSNGIHATQKFNHSTLNAVSSGLLMSLCSPQINKHLL